MEVLVVLGEVAVDRRLQLNDQAEDPLEPPAGGRREEGLDRTEPRAGSRGEVKGPAPKPASQGQDLKVLVGGIVVEDHVDHLCPPAPPVRPPWACSPQAPGQHPSAALVPAAAPVRRASTATTATPAGRPGWRLDTMMPDGVWEGPGVASWPATHPVNLKIRDDRRVDVSPATIGAARCSSASARRARPDR
jgi:hypothetical protein